MANPENPERDGMDVWGNGLMWNQEEEDMGQETFRHFTRDELEKIEQRIFDKKLLDYCDGLSKKLLISFHHLEDSLDELLVGNEGLV